MLKLFPLMLLPLTVSSVGVISTGDSGSISTDIGTGTITTSSSIYSFYYGLEEKNENNFNRLTENDYYVTNAPDNQGSVCRVLQANETLDIYMKDYVSDFSSVGGYSGWVFYTNCIDPYSAPTINIHMGGTNSFTSGSNMYNYGPITLMAFTTDSQDYTNFNSDINRCPTSTDAYININFDLLEGESSSTFTLNRYESYASLSSNTIPSISDKTNNSDATAILNNVTFTRCTSSITKEDLLGKENVTIDLTKLPDHRHIMMYISGQEPTCTTDGHIAYFHCDTCGGNFADQDGTVELKDDDIIINALGHDLEYIQGVVPTCEHEGMMEYYKCKACEMMFYDKEGTKELDDPTLPITDHRFTPWTVNIEPTLTKQGSISRECSICHMFEIRNLPILSETDYLVEIIGGSETDPFITKSYSITVENETFTFVAKEAKVIVIPSDVTEEEKEKIKEDAVTEVNTIIYTGDVEITDEKRELLNDALDNITAEKVVDVVNVANDSIIKINDAFVNAGEDEKVLIDGVELTKKEATSTFNSAVTSSVIIGGKEEKYMEKATNIEEILPEGLSIDVEKITNLFFLKTFNEILNIKDEVLPKSLNDNDNHSIAGIDLSVPKYIYDSSVEFFETTINEIHNSLLEIKECSNEKISQRVDVFISGLAIKSFRDFDKVKADLEFANETYRMILLNIQQTVLETLAKTYNEEKEGKFGPELIALKELYEHEVNLTSYLHFGDEMEISPDNRFHIHLCEDGCFEDIVVDIMRQKFISIINSRQDIDPIKYAEYIALAEDVYSFVPAYESIFSSWVLNTENELGIDITLEELSNAAITDSKNKLTQKVNMNEHLTDVENIIVFTTIGVMVVGLLFLFVYNVYIKKEHK